jgi:hypothetical protein
MSKRKQNPRAARRSKAPPPSREPEPDVDEAPTPHFVPRVQEVQPFFDVVTLLEVREPEAGGVREIALPDDRSLNPPSPRRARRGWDHPVARRATYAVVAVTLAFIFVVVAVGVLRLG